MLRAAGRCVFAAALSACLGAERVDVRIERIVPDSDSPCGVASEAQSIFVRALGDFAPSEETAETFFADEGTFQVDRFPAATRALEIEVRGEGGEIASIGRTFDFDLAAAPESVRVFMAPRRGSCSAGALRVPRARPLVAATQNVVVIAGGVDDEGNPVREVELYDARAGQLRSLGAPLYDEGLAEGLIGASMTRLEDGRIVVVGGGAQAFQVFSAIDSAFSPPRFFSEARAFHAAAALPGSRVLLAGGCARTEEQRCQAGSELLTSTVLDVDSGERQPGPRLRIARIGGVAIRESSDSVVLVGGVDAGASMILTGERLSLSRDASEAIEGETGGLAVGLASGSILSLGQSGGAATPIVLIAHGGNASALQSVLPPTGASLTATESGAALVAGRDSFLVDSWGRVENIDAPLDRREHGAAALSDGTVLLVGGRNSGNELHDNAVLFRPDLFGRWSGSATLVFSELVFNPSWLPKDAAASQLVSTQGGAALRIHADPGQFQWFVLGGPQYLRTRASFGAIIDQGKLVVGYGWRDPENHNRVEVAIGRTPSMVHVVDGQAMEPSSCSGSVVPDTRGASATVQFDVSSTEIRLSWAGGEVLRCPRVESERGHLVVGLLADVVPAVLEIEIVTTQALD